MSITWIFQELHGTEKECSIHRLSEPKIRKSDVKVEEIEVEEHDDLSDEIYKDNVSHFLKLIF